MPETLSGAAGRDHTGTGGKHFGKRHGSDFPLDIPGASGGRGPGWQGGVGVGVGLLSLVMMKDDLNIVPETKHQQGKANRWCLPPPSSDLPLTLDSLESRF